MLIFLGIQSCKSTYQITADSYSKNDTLVVTDFLFQVTDNKTVNAPREIGDSLFKFFKSHIQTLGLPIEVKRDGENKVDYFFLKERYTASSYRAVDTSLIINMVEPRFIDSFVLIPFLEIFNRSIGSAGGYTYRSFAYVGVFIVKNKRVIYRSSHSVFTDSYFEPEFSKIKRNINTLEDWEKAINGAMKEYINRLE